MPEINQRALEWLHRQLKKQRRAQAQAEERHAKLGEKAGCLECELSNISGNIEVIDHLIGLAEKEE